MKRTVLLTYLHYITCSTKYKIAWHKFWHFEDTSVRVNVIKRFKYLRQLLWYQYSFFIVGSNTLKSKHNVKHAFINVKLLYSECFQVIQSTILQFWIILSYIYISKTFNSKLILGIYSHKTLVNDVIVYPSKRAREGKIQE